MYIKTIIMCLIFSFSHYAYSAAQPDETPHIVAHLAAADTVVQSNQEAAKIHVQAMANAAQRLTTASQNIVTAENKMLTALDKIARATDVWTGATILVGVLAILEFIRR